MRRRWIAVALLIPLVSLGVARGAEFAADPQFAATTKGTAPKPATSFESFAGGRLLTIDLGTLESDDAARTVASVAQTLTVGAEGERLDIRHAFASRITEAAVKVTIKVKRVRKGAGRVKGGKTRIKIKRFKAKAKKSPHPRDVGDERTGAALLQPGEYRLDARIDYKKKRKPGGWMNTGWPATPHTITFGARPATTLYADVDAKSGGDGSRGGPFATLQDALDAAPDGATLLLAAGTYAAGGEIDLPKGVVLRGAGPTKTVVDGVFSVSAPEDSPPVVIEDIAFQGIHLAYDDVSHAAMVVRRCRVESISMNHGVVDRYALVVEDSDLPGGVGLKHGAVHDAATVSVLRSEIAGAGFAQGGGNVTVVVRECRVEGGLAMSSGAGATYILCENTVAGSDFGDSAAIADSSGTCRTLIAGNVVLEGGISDSSGGRGVDPLPPGWPANWPRDWPVEDQVIEGNRVLRSGIESSGTSVTIRDNVVNGAIVTKSGAPTIIVGNIVTLPYVPPTGDPLIDDETAALLTKAGAGRIEDNVLRGGTVGISDKSGAQSVARNHIAGAHVGIQTKGAGRFVGNTITGCKGDGMQVAARGPIEGNTITGNGGAGIRLLQNIDLGGGPDGGLGGNVLRKNGDFDLVIECPTSIATVIFARHNVWDHSTAAAVDAHDIYDGKDDPAVATAEFEPILLR